MTETEPKLKVLSLGWGVQSFTLAAMSALGELPKLDMVIHADTTWEREATYQFAEEYTPWLEAHGISVYSACSMSARNILKPGERTHIPAFYRDKGGKVGKVIRSCTGRWKIDIVRELIRQELALRGMKAKADIVEQWLGISWDEASRANNSPVKYIVNRHPFLEKATRMTRMDCIRWLNDHDLKVPKKSSCTHCPFHNQKSWMEQKLESPNDWKQSIYYDNKLRGQITKQGNELFVHRSTKPLAQAVFLPEEQGYSQTFLEIDGPGCDTAGYCWD
jgi:hypothetical protein